MSYRTIGYDQGKPIKVDEGPAYGGSPKLGGSMVVGGPGPVEQNRITSRLHNHKKRQEKAEKEA